MYRNIFFVFCLFIPLFGYSRAFDYDLIVIGAGAAGITAARFAADLGKKVLLIEKYKLGSGHVWSGDIPFKALFKKADILYRAKNLS